MSHTTNPEAQGLHGNLYRFALLSCAHPYRPKGFHIDSSKYANEQCKGSAKLNHKSFVAHREKRRRDSYLRWEIKYEFESSREMEIAVYKDEKAAIAKRMKIARYVEIQRRARGEVVDVVERKSWNPIVRVQEKRKKAKEEKRRKEEMLEKYGKPMPNRRVYPVRSRGMAAWWDRVYDRC